MSGLDYRRVLAVLGDPVVVGDRSARIVYANPAAEKLLGWAEGELPGKPLTAIIPPALRGRHTAGFNRYRATWVPRVIGRAIRVPVLRRNGTELRVELTLSAFRGSGGEELYLATLRASGPSRAEPDRTERPGAALRGLVLLSAALAEVSDAGHLQRRAGELLSAHFGAVYTRIWANEATELVALGRVQPEAELGEGPGALLPTEAASVVAETARAGTPLIRNELGDDPPLPVDWLATRHARSLALFPLRYAGEPEGVLLYLGGEPLTDETALALTEAAAQVTRALRELRSRGASEQSIRYQREAAAYRELVAAAGEDGSVDLLLEQILYRALELTSADEGSLLFRDPESEGDFVVRVCAGYPTPILGLRVPQGTGLTHRVVDERMVTAVEDYQNFPTAVPRIRQRGVQAALGAPIILGERVEGVLKVESKRRGRTFSAQERDALRTLAHLVELVLRNQGAGKPTSGFE